MQLYRTAKGPILTSENKYHLLKNDWDTLINRSDLFHFFKGIISQTDLISSSEIQKLLDEDLLPPIGNQEVWAAGVTYLRSRDARMEESKESGGSDFYQKVYEAERPELFFKALPHRVAGHGQDIFIRKDSTWNVPEPELTLYINSQGEIQAYTVGNDVSSRSIEGENPLYLPQAKSYERSCALGPCLFVPAQPISKETFIHITIERQGQEVFDNSIQLSRMKRALPELAAWLYKECIFPYGCFLMTGTGIVPAADFTLLARDEVSIAIDGIGILKNRVAVLKKD